MEELIAWVNILLVVSVLAVIVGGLWNRHQKKQGIGWQFIRYTVIGIALPISALQKLQQFWRVHWAMLSVVRENQNRSATE